MHQLTALEKIHPALAENGRLSPAEQKGRSFPKSILVVPKNLV
jgi:hypothetical protein